MMKRVALAALALLALARVAQADISVTQGSGTVIFDFTCFTTKHCAAVVPTDAAGAALTGPAGTPSASAITIQGIPGGQSVAVTDSTLNIVTGTLSATAGCGTTNTIWQCLFQMDNDIKGTGSVQGLGTLGTATGGVLTVQGGASMTPLLTNPGTPASWALGATAATAPTNAILAGARAQNAEPTAVTNGQLASLAVGLEGKLITLPYANKENTLRCAVDITGTVATTCTGMGAQGGSNKIYVTYLCIQRDDAGTSAVTATTNAQDSSATNNAKFVIPNNGGGGGNCGALPVPLVVAANTAFQITMGASITTIHVVATGYFGN